MLEWFYFHPIGLLTSLVWIHRYFQLLQKKQNTIFFISFSLGSNKVFCVCVCVCVCARVCALSGFSCVPLWPNGHTSWNPPGSSVHGILQTRTLKWVVMPSSRDLPHPVVEPTSLIAPAGADGFFTTSTFWEAPKRDQTSQKALMKSKIYHFQVKDFWFLVHFACKTDHWGFTLELLQI